MKYNLYSLLVRIVELEPRIKAKQHTPLQFGDKEVIEYNSLLRQLEKSTSEDLIEYHKFFEQHEEELRQLTKERDNEAISLAREQLKNKILEEAGEVLTHNEYLRLEDRVKRLH